MVCTKTTLFLFVFYAIFYFTFKKKKIKLGLTQINDRHLGWTQPNQLGWAENKSNLK